MRYLCLAQCDNEDIIRDALAVGESGELLFDPPKDDKVSAGWKYIIRPPIAGYDYTGNLVFQVRRPGNDERDIITSSKPQLKMHHIEVWANPEASDVSARRLIKCVNDVKVAGHGADELRRYTLAKDLADVDAGTTHDLFAKVTEEQKPKLKQLLSRLSPSQREAFVHVQLTRHRLALIQGPPGTGKTVLLSTLIEAAVDLAIPVISCASSNAATDRIAEVVQERCPHIGAIRYHSVESEARALSRYESESTEEQPLADSPIPSPSTNTKPAEATQKAAEIKRTAVTEEPKETEKTAEELAKIEDEQAWFEFFTEVETKDETWKGSKLARPNFKSMGLHTRALQNANILSHDLECFAHNADNDRHAEFRTALMCLQQRSHRSYRVGRARTLSLHRCDSISFYRERS